MTDERTPPVLDDHHLAGLLAELDAEDLLPAVAGVDLPVPRPATPAGPVRVTRTDGPRRTAAAAGSASHPGGEVARRSRLVIDSAAPDPVEGDRRAPSPADRYVRREHRPVEQPPESTDLAGLSPVGGSRLATVLFTAFFVGIFLLILVEVVVSLLRAGS